MGKLRNPDYICVDCEVSFELKSWPKSDLRKKYCPMCGDYIGVKAMRVKYPAGTRTPWSYEEEQWVDECVAGNLSTYMLAHKTGRKIGAVRSRIGRRREELKIQSSRPTWKGYEALTERCLNNEITVQELAGITGKSFPATRAHIGRERKKRRKEHENNTEGQN